jgi:uncharacterized protein (TIGR03435 family)
LASFALICSGDQKPEPGRVAPPANSVTTPHLEFEVASVKVHPMAPNSFMMRRYDHAPPFVKPAGNRFTERDHLQDLVMEAYGVEANRITGLPAWALSPGGTVYDIEAKAEGEATPTPVQLEQMIQSLLAERFQFRVHREMKDNVPVFALVVDKDGPRFREIHPDEHTVAEPVPGGPRPFTGTTIFALVNWLTGPPGIPSGVDRPVVDRTGLTDNAFDFDINKLLDFTELGRERREDPMAAQSYMFTAVRDKLGLRVEPRKESMEVLVVDHVEEPTPN